MQYKFGRILEPKKEKIALEILIQLKLVHIQTVIHMSVKSHQYNGKEDKAFLYYKKTKQFDTIAKWTSSGNETETRDSDVCTLDLSKEDWS